LELPERQARDALTVGRVQMATCVGPPNLPLALRQEKLYRAFVEAKGFTSGRFRISTWLAEEFMFSDFDFLNGSWKIHNRFLKERLRGSTEWTEFEGRLEFELRLNGLANVDRYTSTRDGMAIEGMSLRLFNPLTEEWSIYWADTVRAGILQPPMVGKFHDGVGEFFGDEEVDRQKVLCRFRWTETNTESPRWEQAFSADGGKTWETNWIMTFTRANRR
jgi:hypothetical protein